MLEVCSGNIEEFFNAIRMLLGSGSHRHPKAVN